MESQGEECMQHQGTEWARHHGKKCVQTKVSNCVPHQEVADWLRNQRTQSIGPVVQEQYSTIDV